MATRRDIAPRMREMRRRPQISTAAALVVGALLVLSPNLPLNRVPSEDEGVFLYIARTIAAGGAPYRDVWDHKPPGVYLLDLLAGANVWGVFVLQAIALATAGWLSYRALARGGLGPYGAVFGTIAWVVAVPRLFLEDGLQTNFPEFYALPLQFGALGLFAEDEARHAPTWRTGALGALGAAAALLKPTAIGLWLTIALVLAFPIELLLSSTGRAYHYYFLPWLPAMGVLAAYLCWWLLTRFGGRFSFVVLAACVSMAIVPLLLVGRLIAVRDDGAAREAATYVDYATTSADAVLVWGSRAEVLVLADRRSATRLVYQYAALATRGYASPATIDAVIADLARETPLLIIDASKDSFVTPPLDRAGLASWTSPEPQYAWPPETSRIVDFVETNYERLGVLQQSGWTVWRLRSR